MNFKLPSFEPVTIEELRRIYATNEDPDIRRLTLEVERYRRLFKEVDAHYKHVHQAYLNDTGKHLFAAHLLKNLLNTERFRLP